MSVWCAVSSVHVTWFLCTVLKGALCGVAGCGRLLHWPLRAPVCGKRGLPGGRLCAVAHALPGARLRQAAENALEPEAWRDGTLGRVLCSASRVELKAGRWLLLYSLACDSANVGTVAWKKNVLNVLISLKHKWLQNWHNSVDLAYRYQQTPHCLHFCTRNIMLLHFVLTLTFFTLLWLHKRNVHCI